MHFQRIGIRNGYVFEISMARPRPKSGQVPPPGGQNITKKGVSFIFRAFKGCGH